MEISRDNHSFIEIGDDYFDYLEPWFNTLKENGGLRALNPKVVSSSLTLATN